MFLTHPNFVGFIFFIWLVYICMYLHPSLALTLHYAPNPSIASLQLQRDHRTKDQNQLLCGKIKMHMYADRFTMQLQHFPYGSMIMFFRQQCCDLDDMNLFKLSLSDTVWSVANMKIMISYPFTILGLTFSYTLYYVNPAMGMILSLLWDPCTLLIFQRFLMFIWNCLLLGLQLHWPKSTCYQ